MRTYLIFEPSRGEESVEDDPVAAESEGAVVGARLEDFFLWLGVNFLL
jgi:hypothetical protein